MALTRLAKQTLAQLSLPDDAAMRARVELFLMKSGFTVRELADMIGYSRCTLTLFLSGRYDQHFQREGNTLMLRARLQQVLDKLDVDLKPRIRKMYQTEDFIQLRDTFHRVLEYPERAYCIDGAPGMGKSGPAEYLIDEVNRANDGRRAYYVYCYPQTSPTSTLKMIAVAAGIPARGVTDQVMRKIQFCLSQQRRALIVLDEAQHLSRETLNTIRALLDRPPYVGLLFMGSHDVQEKFADLRMEQWRRRTKKIVELKGLTQLDAETIIRGELGAVSKQQIEFLWNKCLTKDPRRPLTDEQGRPLRKHGKVEFETYHSVGELQSAIDEIKIARAKSARAASA